MFYIPYLYEYSYIIIYEYSYDIFNDFIIKYSIISRTPINNEFLHENNKKMYEMYEYFI